MLARGPILRHKTVGVIFNGVQAAGTVLDQATRVWNFQHSPFVDLKVIWEVKRVTYTLNTDPETPIIVPAGTALADQFALFLVEDPFDSVAQIPFQRPIGTTPLPAESTFDLEHAFENNTRILDQYGYTQHGFIDTNLGANGAGYAWVEPNIHTNLLPAGVFVVPEFVVFYARIVVGGFAIGNTVLSCWVTLDYFEHLVPTVDKLALAGITAALPVFRA